MSCVALTGDCLVFESETFTADTSPYAVGDVLGTLLTIDGASEGTKSGYIRSIDIFEKSTTLQKPTFDIFVANESYTSVADNSPFVLPVLTGITNVITKYTVNNWNNIETVSATGSAINSLHDLHIPFQSSSTGTLYLNLIIGAAKTYPASSEITVRITIKVNNS